MNRPTDECLEKFYTRIQAILAQRKDKQLKKVAKKKVSETVADAIETSLTSVPEVHLLDIHGNEVNEVSKQKIYSLCFISVITSKVKL